MDKLPEPEFTPHPTFHRQLTDVEPMLRAQTEKRNKYFIGLSVLSVFRYLREVAFYAKNPVAAAIVVPSLVGASYGIASMLCEDPYVIAADRNNKTEEAFLAKYKSFYSEMKAKNQTIPADLLI